jgi:hypothetical protein
MGSDGLLATATFAAQQELKKRAAAAAAAAMALKIKELRTNKKITQNYCSL